MKIDIDARERLQTIVQIAGSQRAAALQLRCSQSYLNDLIKGRRECSAAMLAKLGLRRTIIEQKAKVAV